MRILTVLLFLLGNLVLGQNYKLTNFNRTNGLNSPSIFYIFKDSHGYMWLATSTGVVRYDGITFKKYELKDGLSAYSVYQIYEDGKGRVWFLTDSGEANYYWKDKIFNPQNTPFLQEFSHATFQYGFLEDTEENIWIGSFNSGFKILKPDNTVIHSSSFQGFEKNNVLGRVAQIWQHTDQQTILAGSNIFTCVDLQKKKKLWEITVFESTGAFMRCTKLNDTQILAFCNQQAAIIDIATKRILKKWNASEIGEVIFVSEKNKNGILIGTRNGLYTYSDNVIKAHSINKSLEKYAVSSVLEDELGNIWVSTLHKGLVKFGNYPIKQDQRFDIIKDPISSFDISKNGKLLIGTQGKNIYKFDKQISESNVKNDNGVVHTVIELTEKETLIFTENKVVYLANDKKYTLTVAIKTATLSNDKKYIFLGHLYGVNQIELNDFLRILVKQEIEPTQNFLMETIDSPPYVNSICQADRLYFGARKGLYYYTNKSSFKINHPSLPNKIYVFDVIIWKKDWIAVATLGHGVILLNTRTNQLISINNTNGLNDNFVTHLNVSNDETIWIKHNAGISSATILNNEPIIKNYGSSDGLEDAIVYCSIKYEGKILLGTSTGVYSFSELNLSNFRKSPSILKFQSVQLNRLKIDIKNQKVTFPSNSDFSINFDFISYSLGQKVKFNYRIAEYNQTWLSTEAKNINFFGLSPGKYHFEIYASNEEGNRTPIENLTLLSTQAWYNTIWTKFLFTGFVLLLFLGLFKANILNFNFQEIKEIYSKIKNIRNPDSFTEPSLLIKTTSGDLIKLLEKNITHISAAGNYVEFYTSTKKYLTRNTLKEIEEQLNDSKHFERIHRSHIINLNHIISFSQGKVKVANTNLPTGKNYQNVIEELQKRSKRV